MAPVSKSQRLEDGPDLVCDLTEQFTPISTGTDDDFVKTQKATLQNYSHVGKYSEIELI